MTKHSSFELEPGSPSYLIPKSAAERHNVGALERMNAPQRWAWVPIPGQEGRYEASSSGHIRSLARVVTRKNGAKVALNGRILSATRDGRGYPTVRFQGERTNRKVHVLIAQLFIGPRPRGMHVCHRDGNPQNNAASNLYYGSPTENSRDTITHGRHKNSNKTHCPRGHSYSGANLSISTRSDGRVFRRCRKCHNQSQKHGLIRGQHDCITTKED